MDLLLLGTGPAEGFPVPGCRCAACARAVAGSRPRRRAARLRLAAGCELDVAGRLHPAVPTVPTVPAVPAADGIDVRDLGGGAVLVRIEGPGGPEQVLWAPQAGELPAATIGELAGTVLSAVFLGPDGAPGPASQVAHALARLRSAGVVAAGTRRLVVGLGHRQGTGDRLGSCAAHWGVRLPMDGEQVRTGPAADAAGAAGEPEPVGGRTLVIGGSASGKSELAEQLLAAEPEVLYLATGPVVDLRATGQEEWAERVRRHREQRPAWWRTVESDRVARLLERTGGPILLDSVGSWLTGVLDRAGAWHERSGWRAEVAAQTQDLLEAWRQRSGPVVAVCEEVGWGVVPATPAGRLFRDELGRLNQRLAAESERVLVVVAGRVVGTDLGAR